MSDGCELIDVEKAARDILLVIQRLRDEKDAAGHIETQR